MVNSHSADISDISRSQMLIGGLTSSYTATLTDDYPYGAVFSRFGNCAGTVTVKIGGKSYTIPVQFQSGNIRAGIKFIAGPIQKGTNVVMASSCSDGWTNVTAHKIFMD